MSITTDEAALLIGHNYGYIALYKKDDDFSDFLNYLCIIYQQVVANKRFNTKYVMDLFKK